MAGAADWGRQNPRTWNIDAALLEKLRHISPTGVESCGVKVTFRFLTYRRPFSRQIHLRHAALGIVIVIIGDAQTDDQVLRNLLQKARWQTAFLLTAAENYVGDTSSSIKLHNSLPPARVNPDIAEPSLLFHCRFAEESNGC